MNNLCSLYNKIRYGMLAYVKQYQKFDVCSVHATATT